MSDNQDNPRPAITAAAEKVTRLEHQLNQLNNQMDAEKDLEKRVELHKQVALARVDVRKARKELAAAEAAA